MKDNKQYDENFDKQNEDKPNDHNTSSLDHWYSWMFCFSVSQIVISLCMLIAVIWD